MKICTSDRNKGTFSVVCTTTLKANRIFKFLSVRCVIFSVQTDEESGTQIIFSAIISLAITLTFSAKISYSFVIGSNIRYKISCRNRTVVWICASIKKFFVQQIIDIVDIVVKWDEDHFGGLSLANSSWGLGTNTFAIDLEWCACANSIFNVCNWLWTKSYK